MQQHTGAAAQAVHQGWSCAIDELGLDWDFDPRVHGEGREGLRRWLEQERPHLLRAYDFEFLLEAVESTRARLARTR
jgi:hypothetical protein